MAKRFGDLRDHEDIHRPGDHLIKALAFDGDLRLSAVDTTEACTLAQGYHDAGPMASVLMGRALTGAALLAQDMKNERETLTVSLRSDGPFQGMTIVATPQLNLRASLLNPLCPTYTKVNKEGHPVLDLKAAVGSGRMAVIRDLGTGEPYAGQVAITSGEIGDELASYLLFSEQRRAAVALAVNVAPQGVGRCGGFLVEAMPGASDKVLDYMEARVGGFPGLDFFLQEGFSAAQILQLLIGDHALHFLERRPLRYHCPCSKERMARNLLTLGVDDLKELAEDPEGINLECHFCDKQYRFSQSEVKALLEAASKQKREQ